jgi:hypothetical protein
MTWHIKRRPIQLVGPTADQDDRQRGPCGLNLSCEFEIVHDGHADVRDQAVNLPEAIARRRLQPLVSFGLVEKAETFRAGAAGHPSTRRGRRMTAVSRQHLVRDGQCVFVDTSSRSCSRRGSCSGYAVLRGEKAPDDALARELGAMGLL